MRHRLFPSRSTGHLKNRSLDKKDFSGRSAFQRRLRCETLEDRRMLSIVGPMTNGSGNEPPYAIWLDYDYIEENQPVGSLVGYFETDDPNLFDTFTYALASGLGDDDNASFAIVGQSLRTAAVFDYETKNTYSVRVRSTDQDGLWTE